MRYLPRCPLLIRLSVSLPCLVALGVGLAGCATSAMEAETAMRPAEKDGIGADLPAVAAAVRHWPRVDATRLTWLLPAAQDACQSPCLSAAQQDAIVLRAIAEHEMRRP